MLSGPATRPKTPLAVANSVGKLAAAEMWRQMPARERELGELPSPIWSLLDRKVGQGLDVFTHPLPHFVEGPKGHQLKRAKKPHSTTHWSWNRSGIGTPPFPPCFRE